MYRIAFIVAGCLVFFMCGVTLAAAAPALADSIVVPALKDSAGVVIPDSTHTITVRDSLGIKTGMPGTLKGTTDINPDSTKAILQRMGSNQAEGRTKWEREKNPKVAMLCHTLLPGLGQVYNGRRLKVGLMVGFASYYYGNAWINYKQWHLAESRRDLHAPGSTPYRTQDELAKFYEEEARTYLWWSGAVWLIGLLDSWIDAHLYDVRTYTPPAPPETATPHASNETTNYLTIGFTLERSK
ncbi:MAG TPA: DUF5683 domain-containing protein [Candidatus Krumholzibacteria bacterium]|nr:DUF5683 domain-containing protein [Candidatus Krumholzibacteria bacterium]